ncbi:MAG TPA: hypothetical protein PLT16_13955 [Daejeonella sp.]|nr:hypothetical protein [Daejeonella sp.]
MVTEPAKTGAGISLWLPFLFRGDFISAFSDWDSNLRICEAEGFSIDISPLADFFPENVAFEFEESSIICTD